MVNKKHIIITAVITFVITVVLIFTTVLGNVVGFLMKNNDGSQKLKKVETLIDNYYIYDYDKEKMMDMALSSYAGGVGDPYTTYIDKEGLAEMVEDIQGNYVGIGVEIFIDKDNLLTVLSPFDHSPAQKAGIMPGDKIIKVSGKDISAKNYDDAISMIRGEDDPSADEVVITIKRGTEVFDVTVKREKITVVTATEKMLANNTGYIHISNFGDNTASEFRECLKNLENSGAKSLIIDLRNNPGGTLESVVGVADSLMGEGNILTIRDKKGNEKKYNSKAGHNKLPLCVIINQNSASASEVLAGAISDSGRGTLVGVKSFGKGVVQTIFELGDGSALKVTTARYFTPGGTCIDKVGITPHIEISLDENYKNAPVTNIPYEKDFQLQKALEVLNKK